MKSLKTVKLLIASLVCMNYAPSSSSSDSPRDMGVADSMLPTESTSIKGQRSEVFLRSGDTKLIPTRLMSPKANVAKLQVAQQAKVMQESAERVNRLLKGAGIQIIVKAAVFVEKHNRYMCYTNSLPVEFQSQVKDRGPLPAGFYEVCVENSTVWLFDVSVFNEPLKDLSLYNESLSAFKKLQGYFQNAVIKQEDVPQRADVKIVDQCNSCVENSLSLSVSSDEELSYQSKRYPGVVLHLDTGHDLARSQLSPRGSCSPPLSARSEVQMVHRLDTRPTQPVSEYSPRLPQDDFSARSGESVVRRSGTQPDRSAESSARLAQGDLNSGSDRSPRSA